MKKFIIQNLTTRSGFITLRAAKPVFGDILKSQQFDSRASAETALMDFILPNMIQQTEHDKLWNYGHVLTVLEVYV